MNQSPDPDELRVTQEVMERAREILAAEHERHLGGSAYAELIRRNAVSTVPLKSALRAIAPAYLTGERDERERCARIADNLDAGVVAWHIRNAATAIRSVSDSLGEQNDG